jgi:tRNA1(Val) A37 N6-methylase TrmN6
MVVPKIEERTLYPPIVNYLKKIGFKAVGECKVKRGHLDSYFQFNSAKFVIEVKIGKPEIGLKAAAQASDYARKLETHNIIILVYPEKYRSQAILFPEHIEDIALKEQIHTLVLTEYWTESLKTRTMDLFNQLKSQISQKKIKVDFKTIVKLIENFVKDLNSIIYQIKVEELVTEVVNKLDLFSSIGEIKDKDTAKRQVINLASYLLFNQLLFYHIYKKKADSKKLKELSEIKKIKNIQEYFDAITDIDYQSIYRVNILGHIPDKKMVLDTLNEVIKSIKLLRAEHITHDLAGRFFHDLIPYEVRKVLAAFYTHPVAAEILANLTIDSWDETVIDPACGSGTLLVASYKRKTELYQKLYGYKKLKNMHKKYIENDLTGIDIMPFAAHISAINLTTQNIEYRTNTVRIATLDSLDMVNLLKMAQFKKKGMKISPYTHEIQKTLFEAGQKKQGPVSPEGKGVEFCINPADVIIMNPPFSDREKMPFDMREKLKKNILGNICGHQINLWGYFLVLADLLLKPEGKIGVVIPINIARGKATEKIRNFLLNNYQIMYIIKPTVDIAFSEGAAFRDVLLIARKKESAKDDITKIVFLKKSIRGRTFEDVTNIVTPIIKKDTHEDKNVEVRTITHDQLLAAKNNFMRFLFRRMNEVSEMIEELNKSEKLIKIKKGSFPEGFHASPKGLSQLLFITNPLTESRIKRAFLILKKPVEKQISSEIKDMKKQIIVQKESALPALRTITGIKTIGVSEYDYFISSKYKDFNLILNLSKWDKRKLIHWDKIREEGLRKRAYLLLPERFNPYSENTHILAFVSEEKLVCPHTIRVGVDFDQKEAKIQGLFINSSIFLSQIFLNKEETTGQYIHLMESDLVLISIWNLDNLLKSDQQSLLALFEKLKNIEFPSILEQLENRFSARIELDKTVLNILGVSDKRINEWLPKIYDALIDEIRMMKNIERKT